MKLRFRRKYRATITYRYYRDPLSINTLAKGYGWVCNCGMFVPVRWNNSQQAMALDATTHLRSHSRKEMRHAA